MSNESSTPSGITRTTGSTSVSFEEKVARWRRIQLGEESRGTGTRAEQGTRYVLEELLDEVLARARSKSRRLPGPPVRLLVSISGFSPLTTILTYLLLRPERVLVVTSDRALSSIDTIARRIVGDGPDQIPNSRFNHQGCDPVDPLSIYGIVETALKPLRQPGDQPPHAVIDITGGKKVMSAAAALVAWQFKLGISYLESEFDLETRQARPGSEEVVLLDNPISLFGEQELNNALHVFRSGAFEAARERYGELAESVAEPARARFMRALSDLYRAWCDLDLHALPKAIDGMQTALELPGHGQSFEVVGRIEAQLDFLRRLSPPAPEPQALLLCFYLLGLHYRAIGRHDFAALLYYRTIESCLARRLELRFSGFSCEAPDYELIDADVETLRCRYSAIVSATNGGRGERAFELPERVGAMSAATLLASLDDELLANAQMAKPRGLGHFRELTEIRNRSVLAHGFRAIDAAQSEILERKAHQVLNAFWRLHGDGSSLAQRRDELRFIRFEPR